MGDCERMHSKVAASLKLGPLKEPLLLIGEHQKTRKIVIWGIKSCKIFLPAGAVNACGAQKCTFFRNYIIL